MATKTDDSKRSGIINLAEEIRKSKTQAKDSSSAKDIEELTSLIETLKKQRSENTATAKYMAKLSQKLDKASNPTTYLRAVMPKFFQTFHENLDTYDKERKARLEIEKIQAENRKKEIAALNSSLDELVKGSEALSEISKRFGRDAAKREALIREEEKALKAADTNYMKNMDTISERLKSISEDAKAQYFKDKGIQLVKVVEDEPSKEALDKIKNKLSEQIEADANRYETEKIQAKTKATEERRYKENMIREQSLFRRLFGGKKDEKKEGGGLMSFFGDLISRFSADTLIPALIKAGVLTAVIAAVREYFTNPEFKKMVDEFGKSIYDNYLVPIWQGIKTEWEKNWPELKEWMFEKLKENWGLVLGALALAFPGTTLTLIGLALKGLWKALAWAAAAIYRTIASTTGAPTPDVPDGPDRTDKGDKKDKGGGKGKGRHTTRDPKTGRFAKRIEGVGKGSKFFDKIKGGKMAGLGRLLGYGSIATLALTPSSTQTPADEGMSVIQNFIDELPEDIELTDAEFDEALAAGEGGFGSAQRWVGDFMDKKNLMIDCSTGAPELITKEEGRKRGLEIPEAKKKPAAAAPRAAAPSVAQSSANLSNPYAQPFAVNPAFAKSLGMNPMIVAPSTTNNNSQTSVLFQKQAVDPSRSIMFQNRP